MPAEFSEYVNLTIYDTDSGQLYREMIEVARLIMPDFNLRRGTLEDALFQSASYLGAGVTASINRLPNGLMQGLVSLMGYQRPLGTRATATATVEFYGTSGEIIPNGTEFRYKYTNLAAGYETEYLFVTDGDTVIEDGTPPTGTINLVSGSFQEIPAPTIGTSTLMPLSIDSDINTVTFLTFANGSNPLSDNEYLNSAKTFLESISTTFVTAKQLEAAIIVKFPYVSRCKVYDLMNSSILGSVNPPDRGVLIFTPDTSKNLTSSLHKGFVSIFVYGYSGPLSSDELDEIQTFVNERIIAGLEAQTYNFKTAQLATSGGVVITAALDSNYNIASAEELIKLTVAQFLSPQSFPFEELGTSSPQLRESTISAMLLSLVPGLRYVSSVQFTPPTPLSYTVVAGSGETANTGSGVNDVKITALSADVAKLEIGQRIRLTDASGSAYTNNSIAVKSKVNSTTFTIDTNYTTTVAASSLSEHFHETSASTTLNFLNRGVLLDVPITAITVTLSLEP